MSFTAPNHARALFWSLSATWLYLASVAWYCAVTAHPLDPLSLALGSVSLGMLVYGTAVVHRLFLVNALPFGAASWDSLWPLSHGMELAIQLAGSALLLVCSVVLIWVVYHARRREVTLARSLPVAFALGLPILVYEAARTLLGVDIFEDLAAAVMRLL